MKIQKDCRQALKFQIYGDGHDVWIFTDRISMIIDNGGATRMLVDGRDITVDEGLPTVIQRISEFDH